MDLNFWPSCLTLWSAGIADVWHCTCPVNVVLVFKPRTSYLLDNTTNLAIAPTPELLILLLFIFNYVYVCVCVWLCIHDWIYPWRPEEGLRLSGAGVIGGCGSPDMWVIGTQFGSSARVNCSLNHWPLLNYFDCNDILQMSDFQVFDVGLLLRR